MPVAAGSAPAARECLINGAPAKSFFAPLLPARPAHFTTVDIGIHELTRVYFYDGTFKLGYADNRLGGGQVVRATYFTDGPITLYMTDGRCVLIPSGSVGSVTYTLE